MTIHPARAVAGLALGAAGFVVGVAALAVLLAKLLVNAGMPAQPADVATLNDVVAVLPFVIGFAGVNVVAAAGLVLGSDWAQRLAVIVSSAGVVIGAFGLFLVVAGHDPFATGASARALHGRGRDPCHLHRHLSGRPRPRRRRPPADPSLRPRCRMNARNTAVPRHALRRGTRGFAAFVTGLAGLVVLGVGAVVLPASSLDGLALAWLVPLAVAFGLAHLVAAYGLVRRRAVEPVARRLSRGDRHRGRGVRAAAGADRPRSIQRHEPCRVGRGVGEGSRTPALDDRPVDRRRSVRLQGDRAGGSGAGARSRGCGRLTEIFSDDWSV